VRKRLAAEKLVQIRAVLMLQAACRRYRRRKLLQVKNT